MALPTDGSSENTNESGPFLDIDAIIAEEAAEKKKQDDEFSSSLKKERYVKIGLLVGFIVLFIGLVVLGLSFIGDDKEPSGKDQKDGSITSSTLDKGSIDTSNDLPPVGQNEFWGDIENRYPPGVKPSEDWQAKTFDFYKEETANGKPLTAKEQATARNESVKEVAKYNIVIPGVFDGLQNLPSREAGFTDNPDESTLEDGSLNPMYSYWTLEGFNESVNHTLQRFVNPLFGNWELYQYASSKDLVNDPNQLPLRFRDVYDLNYLDSMKDKPVKDWLPVYADWAGNNYGLSDKLVAEPGPRWMGKLENVNTVFNYEATTQTYLVNVEADVKYEVWTKDQEALTKTGKITFDVIPGEPGSGSKYLITNSKLEVN
jgi:hypothetical protein